MARNRLSLVSDNHLLLLDGEGSQLVPVVVGSAAWYTWLADEQNQSFAFRSHLGTFTARRERKRRGWYWYAYRKHAGKLHKAYLGKAEDVTLARLNATAAALIGQDDSDNGSNTHQDHAGKDAQLFLVSPADIGERVLLPPIFTSVHSTELGRATRRNLPTQFTRLLGREQEVAALCSLLRRTDVHLVTLTGTGGVGKTHLALQVAANLLDDFANGVCFVPLAPISDSDLVISTIAQVLSLKEVRDQPLCELLKTYLQDKHLLLLLDNFEQVAAAAPKLSELVVACPHLKLLVTSRAVLHIRGEHQFPVPPLALPDLSHLPDCQTLAQYAAVALFLQHARAARPDFQMTLANARAIAEICTHLDGLPLAIELAAARIQLLPPHALLTRLAHRLRMLTGGAQDAPARQQTLRNTIAWSYHLLNTEEQRLFRRLCVFVDGCTLEAAEAVAQATGNWADDLAIDVLEGVASLLDKSLLQQVEQPNGEPHLLLLETIREYGLECLSANGEMEATRQAHATYYLALAEEAEPELGGPQQAIWLERLEQEHGNLRAAMHWSLERAEAVQSAGSRIEMALRLGGALRRFWNIRSHLGEGQVFLERALAASEGGGGPMSSAADIAMQKGIPAPVWAKALIAVASLTVYQGDLDRGEALCEKSLALYQELRDAAGIAFSFYLLGCVAWMRGNVAAARSLNEESLRLCREVGDKEGIADELFYLAFLAYYQGEYAGACTLFKESLAIHRELGNKIGIARSLFGLAQTLFVSRGDPGTVRSLNEESLALAREMGDKVGIVLTLGLSAQIALLEGDADTARSLADSIVVLCKETGDRTGILWSLSLLARVVAVQGDHAAARALYEESLTIFRELHYRGDVDIPSYLEGWAGTVAAQRPLAWAVRLWGSAEAQREAMGAPLTPVERTAYEQAVSAARTQLGEKAFVALWGQGRTLTPEQALNAEERVTMSIPPVQPAMTSTRHPTSPAGLTVREVEVLCLVARGLTDAQVAEKLIISPRTVNSHLTSIYSKIQVSSRSAATLYAIEHKLV